MNIDRKKHWQFLEDELKAETEESYLDEAPKYEFVVEENFHQDSQKIFEKKILPLYKNTNSPTPTNNGLIGMKQKKIQITKVL